MRKNEQNFNLSFHEEFNDDLPWKQIVGLYLRTFTVGESVTIFFLFPFLLIFKNVTMTFKMINCARHVTIFQNPIILHSKFESWRLSKIQWIFTESQRLSLIKTRGKM